jgi:pyroglutamyl-peptidase
MGIGPLLICGFGPFPAAPENPAGIVVGRLKEQGWKPSDFGAAYAVLPTEWEGAPAAALAAVRAASASGVLLVGVAVKAIGFQIELRAVNHADPVAVDAAGAACGRTVVAPDGPELLPCTAPAEQMLEIMRGHNLSTGVSTDAGAYICNATYYHLLAEAGVPVVLLHVPQAMECGPPGGVVLAEIERAVQVAAEAFAADLSDDMA